MKCRFSIVFRLIKFLCSVTMFIGLAGFLLYSSLALSVVLRSRGSQKLTTAWSGHYEQRYDAKNETANANGGENEHYKR